MPPLDPNDPNAAAAAAEEAQREADEQERLRAAEQERDEQKARADDLEKREQDRASQAQLQEQQRQAAKLQPTVREIYAYAADETHALHHWAKAQVMTWDSVRLTNERLDRVEAQREEDQEFEALPERHRAVVKAEMKKSPGRFGDPEVAFEYLKSKGVIKSDEQEKEAERQRIEDGRRANSPGLPSPTPVPSKGKQDDAPATMPAAEYNSRVRTEPRLRALKDAGKLDLVY